MTSHSHVDPRTRAACDAYARHASSLLARARRVLRSRELAEDAVQDVFLALWRRGAAPRDAARWLSGATSRHTRFLSRSRSRSQSRELRSTREQDEGGAGADPVLLLQQHELGCQVREALQALPEAWRVVLELCVVQESSYAQAARALSIPVGTVRSRLARARAALRVRLGEQIADLCDCRAGRAPEREIRFEFRVRGEDTGTSSARRQHHPCRPSK